MSDISRETVADRVALLEMRRPPNNLFDEALLTELADAYLALDDEKDVTAVVLCRPVSGEEAAGIGLCDAVADDPRKAAVELAIAIAASAPLSVPSIRATLRRSLVSEVSAALDLEADAQAALLDTADFAEGIAASIGKRPPQFTGS